MSCPHSFIFCWEIITNLYLIINLNLAGIFTFLLTKKGQQLHQETKKIKDMRLERKTGGNFYIITSTTKRKDVIKLHEPNKLI